MAAAEPDYDALAQKYGSAQEPDYDSLAQKYGATTPAAQEPSASQRFWAGAKAGTGGENALNTAVDPAHPISSNPMIPGAGVYRDIKSHNYAGAAGRIAGPAAEMLPFLLGGKAGGEVEAGESSVAQPSTLATRVKGVGKLAVQDAASHVPVAGRLVRRPSIGDYWKAITAKPIPTEAPVDPSLVSPSRTLPGENPPLVVNRPQPAKPIPSRPGLMLSGKSPLLLPEKTAAIPLPETTPISRQPIHGTTPSSPLPPLRTVEPPEAAQAPAETPEPSRIASPSQKVTPKAIGEQLEKSLGAKPLKRNVSLRNQIAKPTAKPEAVSPQKIESSVIASHEYLPDSREMHIATKSNPGTVYVYGDVDPEQANVFDGPSKGKAWAEFKKGSSPLIAKIKDGTRIPVKPIISSEDMNTPTRVARPNPNEDLTPLLKKSVKLAKSQRAKAAD